MTLGNVRDPGLLPPNRTPDLLRFAHDAFNLLGIDRWVRSFFYVNYFDSFEGTHRGVRAQAPPAP